ncbi:MAG: hypothetical protein KAS32_03185 [Candidatus Peribacteraceae bacterium]|nr:hypothetical protein [Candidatus Peribacteraceae bacterium]
MSLITVPGRDVIVVNEESKEDSVTYNHKVHLVRLSFDNPTDEKMEWVIHTFNRTNRYIVDINDIRYYNYYLKRTNLKYYIINTSSNWRGLVSFFKRNNKVLLDTTILGVVDKQFVFGKSLQDILSNLEVILMHKQDYINHQDILSRWKGDVIIHDDKYPV